ncbi:hypothetical protein ACHAPU_010815 [Fusarium lateritium]
MITPIAIVRGAIPPGPPRRHVCTTLFRFACNLSTIVTATDSHTQTDGVDYLELGSTLSPIESCVDYSLPPLARQASPFMNLEILPEEDINDLELELPLSPMEPPTGSDRQSTDIEGLQLQSPLSPVPSSTASDELPDDIKSLRLALDLDSKSFQETLIRDIQENKNKRAIRNERRGLSIKSDDCGASLEAGTITVSETIKVSTRMKDLSRGALKLVGEKTEIVELI